MPDLADVLEFVDPAGDVLAVRFPEEGPGVIRRGSQLIVREGQSALFLRDGRTMALFEPGDEPRPDALRPEGGRHPARLPPARPRGTLNGNARRAYRGARVVSEPLRPSCLFLSSMISSSVFSGFSEKPGPSR